MLFDSNDSKLTGLPSRHAWMQFESSRRLMEPRRQIVSTIFRLISISFLISHVPLAYVFVWAICIFATDCLMRFQLRAYAEALKSQLSNYKLTEEMKRIIIQYKQAWFVNCIIWGGLAYLAQFWLPERPRLATLVILNGLMFFCMTRTCVDKRLMHSVTAILVSTQVFFVVLRFVLNGGVSETFDRDREIGRLLTYFFYFGLISFLLWVAGSRFHQIHQERLDFEYSKLELIQSLSNTKEQLEIEQKALVSANKMVQQFYSGAAHDLRQPVYAMQLYADMLKEDPSQGDILLPKISQSCDSINEMFNTLFDYQQTHLNDMQLEDKKINIEEAFKSLTLNFQPIANSKGLELRLKPIPGSITMAPLYLVRIVSNLITNALRYTNSGGVLIAVRKNQTRITLEVWDTGIGMDEATVTDIFDEFYKANQTDIKNDGLGLGLSIVKQLSSLIDGSKVIVKSRLGKGSVFRFSLPISRFNPI